MRDVIKESFDEIFMLIERVAYSRSQLGENDGCIANKQEELFLNYLTMKRRGRPVKIELCQFSVFCAGANRKA